MGLSGAGLSAGISSRAMPAPYSRWSGGPTSSTGSLQSVDVRSERGVHEDHLTRLPVSAAGGLGTHQACDDPGAIAAMRGFHVVPPAPVR